jgi:hypothetical protein
VSGGPTLRDLQGWLQAIVRHPDAVAEAVASEECRRWLVVAADALNDVVRPSAALTAEQRLGLYARSYRLRLLECMRELHPGLDHALGRALFDDFALDYLQANASTSYTLLELDQGFADHLAATEPQLADGEEPWPSFVVDLARLERLFFEVYHGPGVEAAQAGPTACTPGWDQPRVLAAHNRSCLIGSDGELPGKLPPVWAGVTVSPVPSLKLLASPYPVGRYLLAVRRGEEPALPRPEPCFLALNRRDYTVVLQELEAGAYRLLDSLVTGAPMAEAVASAGIAPAEAWQAIRSWAVRGYFRALRPAVPGRQACAAGGVRAEREPTPAGRSVARS